MTTKTRIEELWEGMRLDASKAPIGAEEYRLVRIDPEYTFDIFAGMDGSGYVMLAIGVGSRPPMIDVKTGALDYFRQQRAGGTWLMALRLAGNGLDQVFGRLCQDLIDAALTVLSETALVALFRERLHLWQRLFRQGADGLLQKHEIKGLLAELLALEHFLSKSDAPSAMAATVLAWTGPVAAQQDFVFQTQAFEIKAISPSSGSVGISSAGQLDAIVPLELWTYVLREGNPTESETLTLARLVSRIEGTLAASSEGLSTFRQRLLEAGYVEHEYYEAVAYAVMGLTRYEVTEDFPRFRKVSIPEGICDVSYSILLSSIAPFSIQE